MTAQTYTDAQVNELVQVFQIAEMECSEQMASKGLLFDPAISVEHALRIVISHIAERQAARRVVVSDEDVRVSAETLLDAGWETPLGDSLHALRAALESFAQSHGLAYAVDPVEQHPDDHHVEMFADDMKRKLAAARAKGRGGWDGDEQGMQQRLSDMLRDHVLKGDPCDVANFCMFLHQRGEGILAGAGKVPDGWDAFDRMVSWLRAQANTEKHPFSRASFIEAHNAAKQIKRQAIDAATQAVKVPDVTGEDVRFACWLIDHQEREVVTEESVQQWLNDFRAATQEKAS
jgi:hypothetical protein